MVALFSRLVGKMMMSTGIVPDAMVSRCLVDAFAMDDSFTEGGAHPLSLLDWSKFQPKQRDGRYAIAPVMLETHAFTDGINSIIWFGWAYCTTRKEREKKREEY